MIAAEGVPLAKVLIVESDVLQALALEDEVVEAGHAAIGPAASVAAALELINRKPPDLALLEVVLSDRELVYPLARKLEARGIPFAFVSARPPARIRARWQGRPLLRKPYDREQVRRLLHACLVAAPGRNCAAD
jgi:DNA-binding response OmpR family regulator